tara:strand:- start:473 stop:1984 length:1512 start_codon:yes stop_codon:yes gene_type:complete
MQKNEVAFAGEFYLQRCELISSSGLQADITNIIVEINLFEDIFKSTMTGSIIFVDTNNLTDMMPIIGQEFVAFKISTPGLDYGKLSFDYTENVFAVYEMGSRIHDGGSDVVELKLCSPELLRNERTRVSKAFEGTVSETVLSILQDEKYINTKKDIFIEPSVGVRKILSPNFHPFSLIKNLTQEAIAEENNSPHYLFFENTSGFNFRSLQSLFKQGIGGQYHYGDKGFEGATDGTADGGSIVQAYKRILTLDIPQKQNQLLDVSGGMLGSTLIMHDIYNKKYLKSDFAYFRDHNIFERLEGDTQSYAPTKYNYVAIDDLGNTVGSFSNAKMHVHPTSTTEAGLDAQYMEEDPETVSDLVEQGVDSRLAQAEIARRQQERGQQKTNPNYAANNADKWLLQRQQRMHELKVGSILNMTIHGNTTVQAGQIIEVRIPVPGIDHEGTGDSKLQTGRYLISKLRHTFSQTTRLHLCHLQATKDSSPIDIPSVASGQEPTRSHGTAYRA